MDKEVVNLLLIEDSPVYAKFVTETLRASDYFDYHITHVLSLAESRQELSWHQYDIVLLDLVLENGEGTLLVREIRSLAPKSCLIVVTGNGNDDNEIEAREELCNSFLHKKELTQQQLLIELRNSAIYMVKKRQAKEKMTGMDTVGKMLEDTIKTCEETKSLPPYEW